VVGSGECAANPAAGAADHRSAVLHLLLKLAFGDTYLCAVATSAASMNIILLQHVQNARPIMQPQHHTWQHVSSACGDNVLLMLLVLQQLIVYCLYCKFSVMFCL
jgi:hypothetical protein